MSSTSQLTTFSDLYTDLLNRVRVSTSVTATTDQAKRYINIALHDIHLGTDYKLPWMERQTQLKTKAPYSTGTVSVLRGGTTLTGSGTAWNTLDSYSATNMAVSGKIMFSGSQDVYRISTVSSDTNASLTSKYIADSDLSAGTYTHFQDEYDLSSTFLRPVDLHVFSPGMNIALISRSEFRRRFPVVNVPGKPKVACLIDTFTSPSILTPVRKIVFYPYPDKEYLIDYTFITANIAMTSGGAGLTSMSSDTDVPVMPLRYRHAIIFHALSHWYRDRKDDSRAQLAKAEYEEIMSRIVNDQDIATHMTAQMRPLIGSYKRSAFAPYGRSGGGRVFDLNDEFDSFRR